ncbi:unnamed protein product, partial [Ectocarpus fasciculatus]
MGNSAGKNKKVIVVGTGYCGLEAAKALDGFCDVSLIGPGDALENKWSYMRGCVVPGWEEATRVPLDKLLKRGKILRGLVTEVTDSSVTLADGTTLAADYIVLAHGYGSANLPGGTPTDATDSAGFKNKLKEKQAAIRDAKTILVVGGGPVGVELVGEIKAHYPDKTVTLVHSQPKLLNNSQPPLIDAALEQLNAQLEAMGIEVRLETRVTDLPVPENGDGFIHGRRTYTLSNDTRIDADLAIICVGSAKRDGNIVPAQSIDESNRIKVKPSLQVEGFENVYCVGDANNVDETKLAFLGQMQAAAAVKNIKNQASGKKIVPYKPASETSKYGAMFIPLGPKKGVGAMDKSVMGPGAVRLIKGKGLFT